MCRKIFISRADSGALNKLIASRIVNSTFDDISAIMYGVESEYARILPFFER